MKSNKQGAVSAVDWKQGGPVESVMGESLPKCCVSQFMNCVYPSAPVTITSIQILMASAEGATT